MTLPGSRRALRHAMITLAFFAIACGSGCESRQSKTASNAAPSVPPRPSILILSIDTLRHDHLGCAGYAPYREPVSPAIDTLAEQGTRFTACFAPRAQTLPSLTSLLTGMYPSRHGVHENAQPLSTEIPTLFEQLSPLGYETAAFLSFLPTIPQGHPARGAKLLVWGRETGPGGPRLEEQSAWDSNTALKTIEWINARDAKNDPPFFAWVHFYDVHQPYVPAAPFDRMFVDGAPPDLALPEKAVERDFGRIEERLNRAALQRLPLTAQEHRYVTALYDGGIRGVDRHVAAILDALAVNGLDKSTLVILTADHGEELGDHHDYYFHGNSVYDGALRVPLILRWPGKIPAGATCNSLVQNLDLPSTLYEILGLAPAPQGEGVSFLSLINLADTAVGRTAALTPSAGAPSAAASPAASTSPRSVVFSEWQDLIVTARTQDWKYISNPRGVHPKKPPYFGSKNLGFPVRCEELYRVAEDPRETADQIAAERSIVDSLRGVAAQHTDREGGGAAMLATEDEVVTDELRSLGYVGAPSSREDVVWNAETCGPSKIGP